MRHTTPHQQLYTSLNQTQMIKPHSMIYLIVLLALNFSCTEKKSPEKDVFQAEHTALKTDSLTFTSSIRAIFEDSQGNFWFGSHQEGVALFDGKSFTYYTTNEGLADNQIRSIQEDHNGTIWLGTANGVSSYKKEMITNHIPVPQSEWMKTDADLWFNAGNQEGVYRYNGQTLSYLAFPSSKTTNTDYFYAVTGLSKGKNNMIWMSTYASVFGYNGTNFSSINNESLGLDIEAAPLHVRSILEDSKGRLWIGNNGIGVLLKEGDSIVNFSEKNNLIHPASTRRGDQSPPGTLEHVFTITEDSQGNIWFGDRDAGVWKYDGKTMTNYTQNDGLTSNFAQSIYEDKNGQLWFGTFDGNVFTFNGTSFEKRF